MCTWSDDVRDLHSKYGFHDTISGMDDRTLRALLEFRKRFLKEELTELDEARTGDDVVDALIDLIVVAIGTLDLFRIDQDMAWRRVHAANMKKERGMKETRKNDFGFPDLTKPTGWSPPSHEDNVGLLGRVFND